MNLTVISTRSLLLLLTPFLILTCKNEEKIKDNVYKIEREKEETAGMTDFDGATAHEFNMLKNPTTGTIPVGSREQELAQAREILSTQEVLNRSGRIAANPYIFQGPNNLGGRTRAIVYDVRFNGSSIQTIMAGGVSGGVFKSTDNGTTWVRKSPTGEHFSCTAIAQDPRPGNQDTWYYGVGEATGNSASETGAFYAGNGVYKSIDNGETWTRLVNSNVTNLEVFNTAADFVNKIVVDPTNGNVYAACPATILRSIDGGTNWNPVLSGGLSNSGQYTDIVVSSTGRLYAGFGGSNAVGADGVWTSTTGASASWTRIAGPGGTPVGWNANGAYGRVVLAIAPSSENIVYALYYNNNNNDCSPPELEAELYSWNQATTTWSPLLAIPNEPGCSAGNDPFAAQGGYDLVIVVKPDNATTVYIGGTNIYRSTDGGGTWTRIGGYNSSASYALYANSHPDIHAIAFQPGSPAIMLCGNDGGIQRTTDDLATPVVWSQINTGYRTYQYYYVELDPRTANTKVIGGAQDNGTTRNIGGTGSNYESVLGGDGVSVGLSGATDLEYCGFQLGDIARRPAGAAPNTGTLITPTGESGSGLFVTLFKLDPDNTQMLYYANDNALYRTATASTVTTPGWTSLTAVATAVGGANDISAIGLSRGAYNAGTTSLFIGTSNGNVFRLNDPINVAVATAPVNITGAGFPAGAYVSSIAVNPRNDDTVLVCFSNYGVSSLFWTGNANSATPTWTAVEGGISLSSFRSAVIHAVPNSPQVRYFVGTSTGLYTNIGLPGNTTWTQEGPTEVGNALVSSLAYRPADAILLVGTHGYGMWNTNLNLVPLPIELTEFTGELVGKTVKLDWTTEGEYSSKHFEVEKSFDGINYRKIATVAAAGLSTVPKYYTYIDKEPLTEFNYYRLRSVDLDNSYDFSNVVLIKVAGAKQDMMVLGNPFKDKIAVRFVKSPAMNGELRLTDMSGRLMARKTIAKGEQQVEMIVPTAQLSAGVYVLQAIIGTETYTSRMIRQ